MARAWRIIATGAAGMALLGAAPIDPDVAGGLLHLAPAAALLGLLLLGRYVGADAIVRLVERGWLHRGAAPPAAPAPAPTLRAVSRVLARGGALLGAALAVRPPPAAALALR